MGFSRKLVRDFLQTDVNMMIFTEQTAFNQDSYASKILVGSKTITDYNYDRIRTAEDERLLDMAQGKIEFSLKEVKDGSEIVNKNSEEFII